MKTGNFLTTILLTATLAGCTSTPVKAERNVSATAPQIYSFESDANGFNTKNYFYDNGEEVVVFDTQFTPDLAQKSIDFLRTKTSDPITYVVITHPNPDKFNGMSVFQKLGAKVISSTATAQSMKGVHEYKKYYFVNIAKMFTDASYPELSTVDETFDKTEDLKLKNGDVISLRELSNPGVSSNQTVAFIPNLKSVVVGDLVHHNVHAWLEGGIVNGKPTPTLAGWINDLKELNTLLKDAPETAVYGGRGEVASIKDATEQQITYLKKADKLVTKYVASLGSRKAELKTDKAGDHYKAIQADLEKAFPGYGLGYMIQYGVYGLVNSKL